MFSINLLHRDNKFSSPENFLEMRRVFQFGENIEPQTGLDFLEKSDMGQKLEEENSLDVQSKLGFLKQKISVETKNSLQKMENTSEVFATLFETPEGVENYTIRKETFEKNKLEILAFAEKTFSPFDLKALENYTEFSGAKLQNIALKRWLKNQIFNPQNFLLESQEREKNNISEKYSQEYFDNPENILHYNKEEERGCFNVYSNPENSSGYGPFLENSGSTETSENTDNISQKYSQAISDLYENMEKKGEKPRKNSVIIISDISNNRLIVRQNGKPDEVIPAVFGKNGIGSGAGSRKTPLGSFKLKTRNVVGEGNPASRTPNITGASISLFGLESSNNNSFGRGILIHGMPEVTDDDIVSRATTHGCTGLSDESAIKLANIIKSAPSAYMQQIK